MMVAQPLSLKLITRSLAIALLLAMFTFVGRGLAASDLGSTLKPLYTLLDQTDAATKSGDYTAALSTFQQFQDKWLDVEDGVKAVSRDDYKTIEDAMVDVRVALKQSKADDALQATAKLRQTLDHNVQLAIAGTTASTASGPTLSSFLSELGSAHAAIAKQDAPTALTLLDKLHDDWFAVEDQVKGRSVDAYKEFETKLPLAIAALKLTPPDYATAAKLLGEINATLTPIAAQVGSKYTAWEAGIVLLREGFEAILIIAALVAFVVKSGNADKRIWIWGGGAVGIVASIIAAVALQAILGAATSGANGALIEGIVGLIAAAMLFYVSYWLHSKSSAAAWTKYIKSKTSAAIAGGSLFSLALLAFLSVFREGAETAMFYLGMAGSISLTDLLLGIAGGLVALVIIAVLMLKVGVRIPIHIFFLISSALIYYLGFKFIGTSILALQGAGLIPAHAISWLPSLDFIGFYPTIEGVVVQGAIIIAAIIVWLYSRRHQATLTKQAKMQPQA